MCLFAAAWNAMPEVAAEPCVDEVYKTLSAPLYRSFTQYQVRSVSYIPPSPNNRPHGTSPHRRLHRKRPAHRHNQHRPPRQPQHRLHRHLQRRLRHLTPLATPMEFLYLASTLSPATMTPHMKILPTHTYENAPRDLDIRRP